MELVIDMGHIMPLQTVLAELTKEAVPAEAAVKDDKVKLKEKVDKKVLESLEDILHGSPIAEAKHDIDELKEKIIEHTEVTNALIVTVTR